MHDIGDRGWCGLLETLTDEELGQYGALAQDQIDREERWRWAHVVLFGAGAIIAAWGVVRGMQLGFDRNVFIMLVVATSMAYWPYRSRKTQNLWLGHAEAVTREQGRRSGVER